VGLGRNNIDPLIFGEEFIKRESTSNGQKKIGHAYDRKIIDNKRSKICIIFHFVISLNFVDNMKLPN